MNESVDGNGHDRFTHVVVLDSAAAKVRELPAAQVQLSTGMAADAESVYWIGDGRSLWCLDRGTGQQHPMGPGPLDVGTVRIDRGHVVWSAYSSAGSGDSIESYVAEGCGLPRRIELTGSAIVALDWPSVYVHDPATEWGVRRANVETGATAAVPTPSRGVLRSSTTDDNYYAFAADGATLAWSLGRRIFVLDLSSGRTRQLPVQVPVLPGENGMTRQVTVGARTVAVAASGIDGGPNSTWGLLYDLRTGRVTKTSGEAWVAGPWTARLEGDRYLISRS